MDAGLIVTLIVGLLGGGTLATLVQFFVKRKDSKNDDRNEIKADIKWLREKSSQRDIEVSQLKILNLIQHSPKDHKAITMELDNYFLVLRADSWLWDYTCDWAKSEGVDISYLRQIHEENIKRTKGGNHAKN